MENTYIIINRHGEDDYSVLWTDEEHLNDNTYGFSIRGSLSDIMDELKPEHGDIYAGTRFSNISFDGYAMATYNGRIIWTNHLTGDVPPDVSMMYVQNIYAVDDEIVFDLME